MSKRFDKEFQRKYSKLAKKKFQKIYMITITANSIYRIYEMISQAKM